MALTTTAGTGMRQEAMRRFPSGGWHLRALRVTSTVRVPMWWVTIGILLGYKCNGFSLGLYCVVGIWCDLLGNIYLWECPILWNTCHESFATTQNWSTAGEPKQCCLLGRDVSLNLDS